jgi:hypothetical protein
VETVPLKQAPTNDYGLVSAPLWDQVLAVVRRIIAPHHFNTWLKPTHQLDRAGDVLRVQVPSVIFADWIREKYSDAIDGALAGLGLASVSVEFIYGETPAPLIWPVDPSPRLTTNAWQTDRAFDYPTFRVSSGLLASKHYEQIGTAIWEFLWCLDKQTGPHGLVFGGRPVTLAQIADDLGAPERSTRRALGRLGQHRYIDVERAQRGLIIRVLNQKKFGPRRRRL